MVNLSIIFEDDFLVVIDKPPNVSVTDEGVKAGEKNIILIIYKELGIKAERGGIVHRLDKATSGLLLAAKTNEVAQKLKDQFKGRTIKKTYLALVHGIVQDGGVIEGSIRRNPENRFKFTVDDSGRDAVTEYKPLLKFKIILQELNKREINKLELQNYNQFTLLECYPKTGRTHQIRVHLKYIGFPIVGDEKYAGRKTARLDHHWCPRQFLHAAKLEFDHPVTGERMVFESQLPSDLKKVLDVLGQLR